MKRITLFLLLTLFAYSVASAQTSIAFGDAEKYDPDRYANYKGDPYFFSSFTDGTIVGMDGVEYDKVKMNFNGYTNMFEVLQGDRFINLQEMPYKSVTLVDPESQETVTFIRGVHADFRGKYIQLLYESEEATLVRKFSVNLEESSVNTIGTNDVLKAFRPKNNYYLKLKDDPKLHLLKSNKKCWAQIFGNKKLIDAYIKDKKLNLSKPNSMVALLEYAETL